MAVSSVSSEQDEFASIVKGIHSQLREKLVSGIPVDLLWHEHLEDTPQLTQYATAMHALATGPWKKHGGGRIQWCVDACVEYFCNGALEKLLRKDLRRQLFGNPTLLQECPEEDNISRIAGSFQNRKLSLLDVGSCYNPFHEYDYFEVTPIDIIPAVKSVLKCDFLNVPIVSSKSSVNPELLSCTLTSISEGSFDVVVFSLFLSYFPSTEQRMACCIKAHQALCFHGLLLVVTADSSHQNRHVDMMKSWRIAIEALGFHRWKYFKDVHLHCMGFRKTRCDTNYDNVQSSLHSNLFIIQDKTL